MNHFHFVQSLEALQGGGLGGAALGFHIALQRSGYHSNLIATRDKVFNQHWSEVTQLPRAGPSKAYFAPDMKNIVHKLVIEADVVHGHGFYVYQNWIIGAETRRQGKPLIYHAHGFFDPWILAHSKIKKRIAHILFETANFRYASLWRALTIKEEAQIRAQGISAPVVIAPNGLNLEEIDQPIETETSSLIPIKTRANRLLFLARLHPKKGLDLLVNAWAALQPSFPDWELMIVGPDENGYQQILEKMISDNSVSETCKIHGPVSGAIKHAMFRSADLFILPSYSEGFSVAILEAAAHRLPVVMSDECNFPELEKAGAAWVCKPEINSVIKSLRSALEADSLERIQRGANARRLIEQEYTWSKIACKITQACDSIAK